MPGYVACDRCGTLCIADPPSGDALYGPAGLYQAAYWGTRPAESGQPDLATRQVADLSERALCWLGVLMQRSRPPARVLEIGCGPGAFAYLLQRLGYQVTVNEVAAETCDTLRDRFGLRTVVGVVPGAPLGAAGPYDCICAFDVLEHVPDPLQLLREVRPWVAPGGWLLLQTPRHAGQTPDWYADHPRHADHVFSAGEHLHVFTEGSMRRLAAEAGFAAIEIADGLYPYDMTVALAPAALPAPAASWSDLHRLDRYPPDDGSAPRGFESVLQERLAAVSALDPLVGGAVERWVHYRRLAAVHEACGAPVPLGEGAAAQEWRRRAEAAAAERAALQARLAEVESSATIQRERAAGRLAAKQLERDQAAAALRETEAGGAGLRRATGIWWRSLRASVAKRLGLGRFQTHPRVLVDVSKLEHAEQRDGTHRYVHDLVDQLGALPEARAWDIDVHYRNRRGSLFRFQCCAADGPPWATLFRRWGRWGLPRLAVGDGWCLVIAGVQRAWNRWRGRPRTTAERLWRRSSGLGRPVDVIHCTVPHYMDRFAADAGALVVTAYDCTTRLYPEFHEPANVAAHEAGLAAALHRATRVLCISRHTAADVERLYGVESERIVVTPLGHDPNRFHLPPPGGLDPALRTRYGIAAPRYVVSLGTLEPRKNVAGLVAGFRAWVEADAVRDTALVLIGPSGWGSATAESAATGLPIVRTGFVADADLAPLIGNALAFVYVSHYEGFGLPLLEAMACGVPVIYGENSSMPEVVGDAGVPVASGDPDAIARALQELTTNPERCARLRAAGLARARQFSWAATARSTLAAYEACRPTRVQ